MKWTTEISPLIKEIELRKNPVIVRVNKFDEEAYSECHENFTKKQYKFFKEMEYRTKH